MEQIPPDPEYPFQAMTHRDFAVLVTRRGRTEGTRLLRPTLKQIWD